MAGCDQPVALAVAENEPYCSICHNVTNDWGLSPAICTSFARRSIMAADNDRPRHGVAIAGILR